MFVCMNSFRVSKEFMHGRKIELFSPNCQKTDLSASDRSVFLGQAKFFHADSCLYKKCLQYIRADALTHIVKQNIILYNIKNYIMWRE